MKLTKEIKDKIDAYFDSKTPEELVERLRWAYNAGKAYEFGEHESWASYNKFTGKQKPNNKPTFEEWLEQITKEDEN